MCHGTGRNRSLCHCRASVVCLPCLVPSTRPPCEHHVIGVYTAAAPVASPGTVAGASVRRCGNACVLLDARSASQARQRAATSVRRGTHYGALLGWQVSGPAADPHLQSEGDERAASEAAGEGEDIGQWLDRSDVSSVLGRGEATDQMIGAGQACLNH